MTRERSTPIHEPGLGRPESSDVARWRRQMILASGVTFAAGLWLVVSPRLLGYVAGDAVWNPVVAGGFVAALALARVLGALRESLIGSANAAIGIWLFVSAFLFAGSDAAFWNAIATGGIMLLAGVASATINDATEGWFTTT